MCQNAGVVSNLKLLRQEITKSLRHRVPAGPQGQTVHLSKEKSCRLDDDFTHRCACVRMRVCVTWACVLGSSLSRQPTWTFLV